MVICLNWKHIKYTVQSTDPHSLLQWLYFCKKSWCLMRKGDYDERIQTDVSTKLNVFAFKFR